MSEQLQIELVRLIPAIAWVVFGLLALCLFYKSIRESILPRLSSFKAFGVEASFVKETLDKASEHVPAGDEKSKSAVARRAERINSIVAGAKILLVNDHPEEMSSVIEILNSMKMTVTVATNTDAALRLLKANLYDVVLSDMVRDEGENEGLVFLNKAVEKGIHRPTILTVGRYEPERGTPAYAFAITNRVDELLHYVFDVLERSRS